MIERIYDTISAILFLEFPKNSRNQPMIYDRVVKNWFKGDLGVIPDDISIVVSGKTSSETDEFFGFRKIEYSFSIILYASADDKETTVRIAAEGDRIIRNILNKHKRMWVMDLCPVCGKLPTSPEHFFLDTTHQNIFGVYGTESGPTGAAGTAYNTFRTQWYKSHATLSTPGNVVMVQILSSGANYTSAPSVIFSGGGYGASGAAATSTISGGGVATVTMTNNGTLYTAVPTVSFSGGAGNSATAKAIISTPSIAGIGANTFFNVLNDYNDGIIPSTLTTPQISRFNEVTRDGVYPVREIFDIQVTNTDYDEAVDKALTSMSTISIKFKELMPVERFGPNFSGSAYNPQEAI